MRNGDAASALLGDQTETAAEFREDPSRTRLEISPPNGPTEIELPPTPPPEDAPPGTPPTRETVTVDTRHFEQTGPNRLSTSVEVNGIGPIPVNIELVPGEVRVSTFPAGLARNTLDPTLGALTGRSLAEMEQGLSERLSEVTRDLEAQGRRVTGLSLGGSGDIVVETAPAT